MSLRKYRARMAYVAGLGLCLAISVGGGCEKVKKPTSDPTPPSLVWIVLNLDTGEQADHPGSPTINVKRGARYRVVLKARDSLGVHSIQINPTVGNGEMVWGCKDPPGGPSLGNQQIASFKPLTQYLWPDSDGYVLTSAFLIYDLDFTCECPKKWSFVSGIAKLTGRASNYSGGITTQVITFIVSP